MAETPMYHVGRNSASQAKNGDASKPGGHTTLAPAISDASSPMTRPEPWNSGTTLRYRSLSSRPRATHAWPAEAQRLAWVNGTIFDCAVVPDVRSTSATSSGWAYAA